MHILRNLIFLGLVLVLSLGGCQSGTEDAGEPASRPYSPWVTRSVLDGQARMITLALNEELWAAYSTENCALFKVWKGYVDFDGAVYTTAHGPQPTSIGDAYTINVFDQPWQLVKNGSEQKVLARYSGHRIKNDHAELIYDLYAEGIPPIRVYEQVEYKVSDQGQTGFQRLLTTTNVPPEYQVRLQVNINSVSSKRSIVTDGKLVSYEEEPKQFGNVQLIELEGYLELNSNATTELTTYFIGRPTIKNENTPKESLDEELPLGYRLLARSDCKTCHNKNVKTIGPAYVDIAKRYPTTEENIAMLVGKVKKGGAGIWGLQVMSAHPNTPDSDIREMVKWILSLDQDDSGADANPEVAALTLLPEDIAELSLQPGAITKVYDLPRGTRSVPKEPSSEPRMAGVMNELANISNADFRGLAENFAVYANGYLKVDQAGNYNFRMWSDDGSKLYINGQEVIDHDGIHGTSYKATILNLEEGYYSFKIEFFQGTGDKFLSFNYKRPGSSEFETVPASAIYHDAALAADISGKSLPMSSAIRVPGDQYPLEAVHPAYDLFAARPYDFLPKVGGMDFLDDGRLVVCTWDPTGSVYLLDNLTAGDPDDIEVTRIAQGLAEPLGLKVVDNEIYVLQKQELTQLVDIDGDDIIDEYRNISNGWRTSANFHEFAFGLEYKDGYFYGNLATAIDPGGASSDEQIPDRGKVMKISKETGQVEFIASGLRTPNGIGFGIDGELFVTDNQGDWIPSSKLLHVSPGAWFGSRSVDFDGTEGLEPKAPVVWLPQDEIGNSPSVPLSMEDGPYVGQMIHGEVTHGGVKRVFVESVNGEYQGAVFRFMQGLEAGVNRMVWGPDGSLYVGGIGNPGNWAQEGKLWYGLQRLKFNNRPVFEMLAVRAKSNGLEIEFTQPLKPGDGWDPADYEIRQWRYAPTEEYGGPKIDDRQLPVKSVTVSDDRKRVFIEIEGMNVNHIVYVHLLNRFVSDSNLQIWSTEAWYTMNNIPPRDTGLVLPVPEGIGLNTITSAEREQGWKLLFDGESLAGWKRFKNESTGKSWVVDNGAIKLNAQKDASGQWVVEDRGDIMTEDQYEDFVLTLEWKITNCGNSGIFYSVVESDEFNETWQSGPEMQVLDNTCHPDAQFKTHRAGDLYDMVSSSYETVKPAGEWNKVMIVKQDGHVEHWLNGVKVVEFEMYNDTWNKMIANSKFKDMQGFGQARRGHIALQDHGDAQVWYRNIKIKEL